MPVDSVYSWLGLIDMSICRCQCCPALFCMTMAAVPRKEEGESILGGENCEEE
jgi:hypothetical protein